MSAAALFTVSLAAASSADTSPAFCFPLFCIQSLWETLHRRPIFCFLGRYLVQDLSELQVAKCADLDFPYRAKLEELHVTCFQVLAQSNLWEIEQESESFISIHVIYSTS